MNSAWKVLLDHLNEVLHFPVGDRIGVSRGEFYAEHTGLGDLLDAVIEEGRDAEARIARLEAKLAAQTAVGPARVLQFPNRRTGPVDTALFTQP